MTYKNICMKAGIKDRLIERLKKLEKKVARDSKPEIEKISKRLQKKAALEAEKEKKEALEAEKKKEALEAEKEKREALEAEKEVARDPEIEKKGIEEKEKREALKAKKKKEVSKGIKTFWERVKLYRELLKPRLKTFLVVAIVFFAHVIGFVLWQRYSSPFVYILLGIGASAVIYRMYSGLKKDRDTILEERDRMKALEDRTHGLLENALDCVFTLDLQGNITSFNRRAEQVTGYSKRDVLGNSLGMFLPPEGIKDFFEKLHRAISTGVVPRYELEINTIYGKRNFEMSLTAIKNRNRIVGVQGIGRDITDKKKLEKELKMTTSDLNRWSKRTVKKEMTILEMKNQIKALKKDLETYGGRNS